jgi:hypothetical protein
MKKYSLRKINEEEYTYFIISLTYESILDYIEEIENELTIEENIRVILIDQLLTTGNNKNRFISCEYQNGKIKLFTAKNVDCKENIRIISSQILKDKYNLIENSILTKYQKQSIKEGRAI